MRIEVRLDCAGILDLIIMPGTRVVAAAGVKLPPWIETGWVADRVGSLVDDCQCELPNVDCGGIVNTWVVGCKWARIAAIMLTGVVGHELLGVVIVGDCFGMKPLGISGEVGTLWDNLWQFSCDRE